MSQQGSNYFRQGDQALVIGGKVLDADETQSAAIDDLSLTGTYSTDDTPIETAVNEILAALRSVGIIASS